MISKLAMNSVDQTILESGSRGLVLFWLLSFPTALAAMLYLFDRL
ncbi:MAG: hypothetical protein ABI612_15645 [Betaproteobacteria bacterium]